MKTDDYFLIVFQLIKIPDLFSIPKEIKVKALETENDSAAIYKSKAVGEPPLMYGIGIYFAISKCY